MKTYTIKEAAKVLKVHYITLWKWIKENRIKAIQPSGKKKGKWLIREEDLERFLNG